MRVLVTGGAGFIGSNFIRHMLANYNEVEIVNLDLLTYAGDLRNLEGLADPSRHTFIKGDVSEPSVVYRVLARGCDMAVNFAAESHVDRSIADSTPFIRTNVLGTQVLLEGARRHKVRRFVQISTDEVYGSLLDGAATEEFPLAPSSPYAASKAAADHLVQAYHHTYGVNTVILRSSNNYGPHQYREKLVPVVITNALRGEPVPVYGTGQNIRDWIHVEDNCRAIAMAALGGRAGQVYNISAGCLVRNIDLVNMLLERVGSSPSLIRFVDDRPGHDLRYSMDSSKIMGELGWRPLIRLQEGLDSTVEWYRDHFPREARELDYRWQRS